MKDAPGFALSLLMRQYSQEPDGMPVKAAEALLEEAAPDCLPEALRRIFGSRLNQTFLNALLAAEQLPRSPISAEGSAALEALARICVPELFALLPLERERPHPLPPPHRRLDAEFSGDA